MPTCPDCYGDTSTRGRCPQCRAEHVATGVDHDHDVEPICAGCQQYAPAGDYSETRRGMWFCPGCQSLALRQDERRQVAAETPTALAGAVQWAVGDADAYPDEDPGALEAGFETASTHRAIADGGFHTVTRDGQEFGVVRWQEFDEGDELEIADDGGSLDDLETVNDPSGGEE